MLAYLAGNVGPACGYVGLMLIHVEPKDPKNGNSKKNTVKRIILMVGGLSWGYVGPSWGLCWPILGLCWPILRPILAHVDPS